MVSFQDRKESLKQICDPANRGFLLNIYGEAGIGKSRLMMEARERLRKNSPPTLVFYVDLKPVSQRAPMERPAVLLQELLSRAEGRLRVEGQGVEYDAGQIIAQLTVLSNQNPVTLMFDTTETLQEDMEFWKWLETNLIGPLVVEGSVQLIFAGRIPVPWRRVEVRRAVKLLLLQPLHPQEAARELAREVLRQHNAHWNEAVLEQAISLVLEFSFAHPLLSEKLAEFIAQEWQPPPGYNAGSGRSNSDSLDFGSEFRGKLCKEVVEPFVEQHLLETVEPTWKKILWWVSVLDWFDATILQRYLRLVAPNMSTDKPDYFFVQGLTRLRIHHTVVWREERGDRMHGVIGDIMRHCLQVQKPEVYRQACLKAAEMFDELAGEFEDDPEADRYRQQAEKYRRRAAQEVEV